MTGRKVTDMNRMQQLRDVPVTVLLGLLGAALVAAAWPGRAHAYPQWQFTSGATRCNQCHFAPGGGGLITGYARDAVGDELSTIAGDGAFLHGQVELPSRLQLGGDLRGAFLAKDVDDPDGSKQAWFPMQADLQARLALGETWSVSASGGLRGRSRGPEDIVPDTNFQPIHASRLISREHYVMWRAGAQGAYGRAGRFYAPFGLRLAEHVTYVRRDLGYNLLEESYNLSGGYVVPGWEVHVTLFAPDFVRHIGSEEGGAAVYYERRVLDDRGAVGVQGKYADSRGMKRFIGGAVGKYHLEAVNALLLAELNLVQVSLDLVGERAQMVSVAGVALLPAPGLVVTLLAERAQVDLRVRDARYDAATGLVSWFPYPHFELQVMGRLQHAPGTGTSPSLLMQLHYFL
jgi:hypothetical protein